MKTRLLPFLILPFIFSACATAIHPMKDASPGNEERLVLFRITHSLNGLNASSETRVRFQLDDEKESLIGGFPIPKREDDGYLWAVIPAKTEKFSIREIRFDVAGTPRTIGRRKDEAVASTPLSPGKEPLYVGTILLETQSKKQEIKHIGIEDQSDLAREFSKEKLKPSETLKSAILKLKIPNRGQFE